MEHFQTTVLLITASLGILNLSKFILKLLSSIWVTFFRPAKDPKQYGSWALLTGSTDGIGKALALELASHGLNLVLVGRNPWKLSATSAEIKQKHGDDVSVKTVVIDFCNCRGEEIARIVEEETRGLDLGIVVNNVGLAYPYARFFHEVDLELMESVLSVNLGCTWVARGVVPGMMTRKNKGVIVNVGWVRRGSFRRIRCIRSMQLLKRLLVYFLIKYVAMLSKSMSLEYKQHGIDVQCQVPLLVATKMTSIKKSSLFIPSPEKYSKASIRWIGHSHQICMPYWPHAFQAFIISLIPEPLLDWCLSIDIFSACEHEERFEMKFDQNRFDIKKKLGFETLENN